MADKGFVTDLLDRAFGGSAAALVLQALNARKASPGRPVGQSARGAREVIEARLAEPAVSTPQPAEPAVLPASPVP